MPRTALAAFAAVIAAGFGGIALAAAGKETDLAFTLGVAPVRVASHLAPEQVVCQGPIDVPVRFSRVRFQVGTFRRAGQPLAVEVRPAGGGDAIARARVAGGYADGAELTAATGAPGPGGPVEVCIRNEGGRPVGIYGADEVADLSGRAFRSGDDLGTDLSLVFLRSEPASLAGLVPEMVERATLFAPVGPWALWLLLVLMAIAVPLLLWRALAAADREP